MENDVLHLTNTTERPSSSGVDSANVEAILNSGGPSSPVMPPPAAHVGPLPEPRSQAFNNHARSMSLADPGPRRKSNRMSLSLPLQANVSNMYTQHTPTSSASATSANTTASTPVEESLPSPTGSTNFLTALAAQERKVLELKEELHRAEADLEKLKKQWAMHEATKKRNEARHVQKLQPLNTPGRGLESSPEEPDTPSMATRVQERRQAMMSGTRVAQRKVFASSKHARTLSLLSPDKLARETPPPLKSIDRRQSNAVEPDITSKPTRSSTLSEVTTGLVDVEADSEPAPRRSLQGPPQEAILRTGKQIATDFREGLWTFIEDLRQATVGDEGVNGTETRTSNQTLAPKVARRQGSKASLRSANGRKGSSSQNSNSSRSQSRVRDSTDRDDPLLSSTDEGAFWEEHGFLESSKTIQPAKQKRSSKNITAVKPASIIDANDDDGWDNWDSPTKQTNPSPGHSSNTSLSEEEAGASTGRTSPRTSPRTSTSSADNITLHATEVAPLDLHPPSIDNSTKRDEIPWPSLSRLSAGHLRRTASTLMSEWERSLTPPAESAEAQHSSRSASPGKARKAD